MNFLINYFSYKYFIRLYPGVFEPTNTPGYNDWYDQDWTCIGMTCRSHTNTSHILFLYNPHHYIYFFKF